MNIFIRLIVPALAFAPGARSINKVWHTARP